jgi:hypothetical protein
MRIGELDRKGRLWTEKREKAVRRMLSTRWNKRVRLNGRGHPRTAQLGPPSRGAMSAAARLDAKIEQVVERVVRRLLDL